jgi:hypothetical protein
MLTGRQGGDAFPGVEEARAGALERLGPAIMLAASPKQRLFGRHTHWIQMQPVLVNCLNNCLLSPERCVPILTKQMGPFVFDAVMSVLLYALFVAPQCTKKKRQAEKQVLTKAGIKRRDAIKSEFSPETDGSSTFNTDTGQKLGIRAMMELADPDIVGEEGVFRVGSFKVPLGAPESGKAFCEVLLDAVARCPHLLDTELEQAQYLYGAFCSCTSLQQIMTEGYNPSFTELSRGHGPERLRQWAQRYQNRRNKYS